MGENCTIILKNSQFLGNIHQKYMEESSTIVLENPQFLGNFPQNIWGKYSQTYLRENSQILV